MSNNQGKKGEMVVAVLAASIAYHEDGIDYTRPSVTNSADMGADLYLRHPKGYLENTLLPMADGSYLRLPEDGPKDTESRDSGAETQKSRIDVKKTDEKLGKGTVEKFVADIHKHPDCKGHILVGGSGLTKPAEQILARAKDDFQKDGKILAYISEDGLRRVAAHYPVSTLDLNHDISQGNGMSSNPDGDDSITI